MENTDVFHLCLCTCFHICLLQVIFQIGSVPKPSLVPAPTTVKLPLASGHSTGNRQGHVTKTKTYRFEILVAFRFTNVKFLLDSWHHLYIFSYYHLFNEMSSLANYMAKLLWEWKPRFAVALGVRSLLIVTSQANCDVTIAASLGLVRTVHQIPRANALGIWLPVSHAPSCIVTTNPSGIGLNPLNIPF